jgi:UDP-glucose 4-epimerase
LRDLNYSKFVEQGEIKISEAADYNSHNTTRLDVSSMQTLLMKLRFMQATVRGELVEVEE